MHADRTHTELFEGGHPKLFIMVFTDGCDTVLKDLRCDGLCRHLHGIHSIYQSLEAFVGERRLAAIEFYNPVKEKNILKRQTYTQ